MVITGEAVGNAVAMGVIAFLVSFGIGLALRGGTTRSENIKSSLPLGFTFFASWLVAVTLDLPPRLEPPLYTILVVVICVVATAGSLMFFRMMLRDGSRED